MEPRTVQNYEGFVCRVIEARLLNQGLVAPTPDQEIFNPVVKGLIIPTISGNGFLSGVSLAKSVTPAWTDFLAWCLNAPETPACYWNGPHNDNYFSDLYPFWHAWLKKQGLTDSCVSKYFKDVGFYVMGSGPFSREGTPARPKGAQDPAWSGRYGFWTWYLILGSMLRHATPIEAPKQTAPDLAPDVAEDPVFVGPSFEPRTDPTTIEDKIKRGPKVPLPMNALDGLGEDNKSIFMPDMTPVPSAASTSNSTSLPEVKDSDNTQDFDFSLDPDLNPGKDLIAIARREMCIVDALSQKFPAYTSGLLEKGLITMAEILERAEPSVDDAPAVFVFRYLDRLCRALK
jgi:hypothetical protein